MWGFVHKCLLFTVEERVSKNQRIKKRPTRLKTKKNVKLSLLTLPGRRIYTSEEIHQVVLWGILRTRRGGGAEGPGGHYASQAL